MFSVYILRSQMANRFYIGQTNNFENRIRLHNTGKVPSTRRYKPWELVLQLPKDTRKDALILERKLKNLNTEDLRKFIKKYSI
jgi:putative endonuclease